MQSLAGGARPRGAGAPDLLAALARTLARLHDLQPLLVRRAAFLVHETFVIQPHLHRVAALTTDASRRQTYLEAVAQLRDGLEVCLG
ncbi:hypothetical protein [Serinicoccus marinus]|uniref:hypothetical protein n=1 Tax=Serinicoccus marinus TaxID=247333 RepID=UPI0003B729E1|nr:hypothetical protein [Serinicoccus marinus]